MKYIMFFGSIGVGKTTLGNYIQSVFPDVQFIKENLNNNFYIDKFYSNMKEYAFRSSMEMLLMMYTNFDRIESNKSITIMDNGVEELICYNWHMLEEGILSKEEFKMYKSYYDIIMKSIPKTDLYVYFKCNINDQMDRIKKRNREYEKNITKEFLLKLNQKYESFLSKLPMEKIYIVDTSNPFSLENFKKEFIELLKKIK